jgi:hypothetical protein
MPVQTIRIGNQSVLVEVMPIEPDDQLPGIATAYVATRRGGVDMEHTSVASEIVDAAKRIEATVAAVVAPVASAMRSISADEWSVELSFGFKGGAGIPFLVNGEANGTVKVNAKWKRP